MASKDNNKPSKVATSFALPSSGAVMQALTEQPSTNLFSDDERLYIMGALGAALEKHPRPQDKILVLGIVKKIIKAKK